MAQAAMSIFHHWVAACAIRHQAAIKAAKGGASDRDVSKESIALTLHLHRLDELVQRLGADAVFQAPATPIDRTLIDELFAPKA